MPASKNNHQYTATHTHIHTHKLYSCQKCDSNRWSRPAEEIFNVTMFPYVDVWLPGISPSGSQVMQSRHRSFSWLPLGKNKLLRAAASHFARQTESAVARVCSPSFVSLAIEQHSLSCQSRVTKLQIGYKAQVRRWMADPALTQPQRSPPSSQSAPRFIAPIMMAKGAVFHGRCLKGSCDGASQRKNLPRNHASGPALGLIMLERRKVSPRSQSKGNLN